MNYAQLAFTDAIKSVQERMGSRDIYARMEKKRHVDGLSVTERRYLSNMDSFYMASFGENGYPYIQHRGGPKGFIKIIDDTTIGIIDFSGNRQYISVGNISRDPKVSLIFVSYPLQARLKIYAEAEIVEIKNDPQLYNFLKPTEYEFEPERMMVFHVKAYDWNCPQHITPKYSMEEVEIIVKPLRDRLTELEKELEKLRGKSTH